MRKVKWALNLWFSLSRSDWMNTYWEISKTPENVVLSNLVYGFWNEKLHYRIEPTYITYKALKYHVETPSSRVRSTEHNVPFPYYPAENECQLPSCGKNSIGCTSGRKWEVSSRGENFEVLLQPACSSGYVVNGVHRRACSAVMIGLGFFQGPGPKASNPRPNPKPSNPPGLTSNNFYCLVDC